MGLFASSGARSGRHRSSPRHGQGGVVMVITLIVLVVLLIGAVALFRSTDTSSALAGQLGFRRDLKNQAERGMALAIKALKTGNLSTESARQASLASENYSAVRLGTSSNSGIPDILLKSDSDFKSAGYTINIVDADSEGDNANSGVTVRYVIDRICTAAGAAAASTCSKTNVNVENSGPDGGNASKTTAAFNSVNLSIYRISVRVDGPRGTQAFIQSTMALL